MFRKSLPQKGSPASPKKWVAVRTCHPLEIDHGMPTIRGPRSLSSICIWWAAHGCHNYVAFLKVLILSSPELVHSISFSSPVWSGQGAIKRQWVCNLATSCAHHAIGGQVFDGFVMLSNPAGGLVANYFWTKCNECAAFLLWDNGRHWYW